MWGALIVELGLLSGRLLGLPEGFNMGAVIIRLGLLTVYSTVRILRTPNNDVTKYSGPYLGLGLVLWMSKIYMHTVLVFGGHWYGDPHDLRRPGKPGCTWQ